jgi:hypothetical protein
MRCPDQSRGRGSLEETTALGEGPDMRPPVINVGSFSTADCRMRSLVGGSRQSVVFPQDVVHRDPELACPRHEVDL